MRLVRSKCRLAFVKHTKKLLNMLGATAGRGCSTQQLDSNHQHLVLGRTDHVPHSSNGQGKNRHSVTFQYRILFLREQRDRLMTPACQASRHSISERAASRNNPPRSTVWRSDWRASRPKNPESPETSATPRNKNTARFPKDHDDSAQFNRFLAFPGCSRGQISIPLPESA